CPDPEAMFLNGPTIDAGSFRKTQLFVVGCCRLSWASMSDRRSRRAVEIAERYADDLATEAELQQAVQLADAAYREISEASRAKDAARAAALISRDDNFLEVPEAASWVAAWDGEEARMAMQKSQADLLRHIVGNPFRSLARLPCWPSYII